MRRKPFAQHQARPKKARFKGQDSQAKRLSGLIGGKLLEIAQHQHYPILSWKPHQSPFYKPTPLSCRVQLFGVVRPRPHLARAELFGSIRTVVVEAFKAP